MSASIPPKCRDGISFLGLSPGSWPLSSVGVPGSSRFSTDECEVNRVRPFALTRPVHDTAERNATRGQQGKIEGACTPPCASACLHMGKCSTPLNAVRAAPGRKPLEPLAFVRAVDDHVRSIALEHVA